MKSIAEGAFDSSSLRSIIAYHYSQCSNNSVQDCKFLTSVTLPDSISTIKSHTSYGCESLEKQIKLPASIAEIEDMAFMYCKNLGSVNIPIACNPRQYVFEGCTHNMSIAENFRDDYLERIKLRAAVLQSLEVYQELEEMVNPAK